MTPHWVPASATPQAGGTNHDGLCTASRPDIARSAGQLTSTAPFPDSPAGSQPEPAASCTLSPRPESVKAGRDFTRATLQDWGMEELIAVTELVVSELVTNALRHGIPSARPAADHRVRLRLLAQGRYVMCMVTDPGADIPVLRESGPSAESGRGLNVVESCCARWGWHLVDGGGKVVWALLCPLG